MSGEELILRHLTNHRKTAFSRALYTCFLVFYLWTFVLHDLSSPPHDSHDCVLHSVYHTVNLPEVETENIPATSVCFKRIILTEDREIVESSFLGPNRLRGPPAS